MIASNVRAFVRANLPPPPARVLEVGAGAGELARALRAAGYEVTAIDPKPSGEGVDEESLHTLPVPSAPFDAAVATVSLHHVEPLEESCARLAAVLAAGAVLVIDELDMEALDERAAQWWLDQQRALGREHAKSAAELVSERRHHLHSLRAVVEALTPGFEVGPPIRGPYLYRWNLNESLRAAEEELIAQARLPAVGARLLARRRPAA
jgi:ubiquinone/menaquinone biosynthesis C-methylase UbiE